MAEQKYNIKSGFHDSINKDRLYSAEDMNRPYTRLISEGIFATKEGTPSTDFQVLSANDGMNIIVKKGEGILGKKWIESTSDIAITISNNTGIVPRKDSIIIQVDKRESGRNASVIYREGIASSNPIQPDLLTDDDIVEMRVANIYVAAGVTKIDQVAISDLRGSDECLWITSLVQQVDTSELFRQWQAAYEEYYKKINDELKAIEDGSAYLLKQEGIIQTINECENETQRVPSAKLFYNETKELSKKIDERVVNEESDSTTNTYSCSYLNPQAIFCTIPNEETITEAYKDITTWSQDNVVGKNLTVQNGVIKIGKDIRKVKIIVKLRFYITGKNAIYSYIRKNNNNIVPSWAVVTHQSAGYSVIVSDAIVDVFEGDTITASVYSETSESKLQKNSTTIIVEKIA